MATAAAIVAAVAVGGAAVENRKSRKEQRKARKIQSKQENLKVTRAAAEQVRQAQIARAQIIQAGENQGVGTSSAVAGGAGSVQSQAGGNLAFTQQLFSLQQQANRRLLAADKYAGNAATYGAISNIAGSFIGTGDSGDSGDSGGSSGGSGGGK